MKKSFLTLMGIAVIATTALIFSCNKEEHGISKDNIVGEQAMKGQTKRAYRPCTPHLKFRDTPGARCGSGTMNYCGHDIDAILNGDEVCFVERVNMPNYYEINMIMSIKDLLKKIKNGGELLYCAKNGKPMTFHDDFHILSKELIEFIGTDLIPAGTYKTSIINFKGEESVYIEFGEIK